MELQELQQRLIPFCREKYEDPLLGIGELFKMPGHAGLAYGFTVESNDQSDKWYLRLPPPDVKLQGTADVLRQVAALDPHAWADPENRGLYMPKAEELIELYLQAYGQNLPNIDWYRALAAYKFAIITGFNLMLHRRGKRHDPMWETTKESMETLLSRAHSLLD